MIKRGIDVKLLWIESFLPLWISLFDKIESF